MPSTHPYELIFEAEVAQHLLHIEKKHHPLIRQTIREQLKFEPDVQTRNRKPLRGETQFGHAWEVRCGLENQFRVFYRIDQNNHTVRILAIGIKRGNRLFIGGEEIQL